MCRGLAAWESQTRFAKAGGHRLVNRLALTRALARACEYHINQPPRHCLPPRAQNCKPWPRRERVKPLLSRAVRESSEDGTPYVQLLDAGDTKCLPVVTARVNPALNAPYDDIDLQHAIAQEHWYVCGYKMNMK